MMPSQPAEADNGLILPELLEALQRLELRVAQQDELLTMLRPNSSASLTSNLRASWAAAPPTSLARTLSVPAKSPMRKTAAKYAFDDSVYELYLAHQDEQSTNKVGAQPNEVEEPAPLGQSPADCGAVVNHIAYTASEYSLPSAVNNSEELDDPPVLDVAHQAQRTSAESDPPSVAYSDVLSQSWTPSPLSTTETAATELTTPTSVKSRASIVFTSKRRAERKQQAEKERLATCIMLYEEWKTTMITSSGDSCSNGVGAAVNEPLTLVQKAGLARLGAMYVYSSQQQMAKAKVQHVAAESAPRVFGYGRKIAGIGKVMSTSKLFLRKKFGGVVKGWIAV